MHSVLSRRHDCFDQRFVVLNVHHVDVLRERDRLDLMTSRGLADMVGAFHKAVDLRCEFGSDSWRDNLAVFHDSLEAEFNSSPAADGVYRTSVTYLVGLLCMLALAWIGFPTSQAEYLDELIAMDSKLEAQRIAEQADPTGTVDLSNVRARGKRAKAKAASLGDSRVAGVKVMTWWWVVIVGSWLCMAASLYIGFVYYNVPETVSQQFEDTFTELHPERYDHIPKVRCCVVSRPCCPLLR